MYTIIFCHWWNIIVYNTFLNFATAFLSCNFYLILSDLVASVTDISVF
jgi:hypothetical protein